VFPKSRVRSCTGRFGAAGGRGQPTRPAAMALRPVASTSDGIEACWLLLLPAPAPVAPNMAVFRDAYEIGSE